MSENPELAALMSAGQQLVERVLTVGVDGAGPWKSAAVVAEEALAATGDAEAALQRLLVSHRRLVGATGFVTSAGGAMALMVGLPADVTSFYATAARLAAAIAHVRGFDVAAEQVRSLVLLTLVGPDGTELLGRIGVDPKSRALLADLARVPPDRLDELNTEVGYRLVTRFGRKGAVNLVKLVPFVGGGVGAGVNVVEITTVARSARALFLPQRLGPFAGPDTTVIDQ